MQRCGEKSGTATDEEGTAFIGRLAVTGEDLQKALKTLASRGFTPATATT